MGIALLYVGYLITLDLIWTGKELKKLKTKRTLNRGTAKPENNMETTEKTTTAQPLPQVAYSMEEYCHVLAMLDHAEESLKISAN